MSKSKRKNSDKAKNTTGFNPLYPTFFLIFYIFGITGVFASLILSLNWKRLEKPQWVVPSLAITVGVPVIIIFFAIALWSPIASQPYQVAKNLSMIVVVSLILTLYILPLSMYHLQSSGYKIWREKGSQTLLDYDYQLRRKSRIIFMIFAIMSVVSILLVDYFIKPPQYSGDFIQFEYQRGWTIADEKDFVFCDYDWLSCDVILAEISTQPTYVAFQRIDLIGSWTAQKMVDQDLAYLSNIAGLNLEPRVELTIDGREAIQIEMDLDNGEEIIYQIDTYVVDDNQALRITVVSWCDICLQEDRSKIMDIINSIEFVD